VTCWCNIWEAVAIDSDTQSPYIIVRVYIYTVIHWLSPYIQLCTMYRNTLWQNSYVRWYTIAIQHSRGYICHSLWQTVSIHSYEVSTQSQYSIYERLYISTHYHHTIVRLSMHTDTLSMQFIICQFFRNMILRCACKI